MFSFQLYLQSQFYHWLIDLLLDEKFELYVTDEILLEYEEILKTKYSEKTAANFLLALKELPNVHFVDVYYKWNLIIDADDNKFVDCYIAAGADCLLSNDHHFSALRSIPFPKVYVLTISDFTVFLEKRPPDYQR